MVISSSTSTSGSIVWVLSSVERGFATFYAVLRALHNARVVIWAARSALRASESVARVAYVAGHVSLCVRCTACMGDGSELILSVGCGVLVAVRDDAQRSMQDMM